MSDRHVDPDGPRARIAARQAALVASLVVGDPPPDGVDVHRVEVAAAALVRKRAGEVAHRWPAVLGAPGARAAFTSWAAGRPRRGSFVDGWEFAEHREAQGGLGAAGAAELAAVRARWTRDAGGTVRRRRVRPWWPRGRTDGGPVSVDRVGQGGTGQGGQDS